MYFVIAMFTVKETRQSIILRRLAHKMREETGDSRYRARVEETQPALRELVWISCTRPIRKWPNLDDNIISSNASTDVLFTEPIATSISVRGDISMFGWIGGLTTPFLQLWVFFLWGVLFCLIR